MNNFNIGDKVRITGDKKNDPWMKGAMDVLVGCIGTIEDKHFHKYHNTYNVLTDSGDWWVAEDDIEPYEDEENKEDEDDEELSKKMDKFYKETAERIHAESEADKDVDIKPVDVDEPKFHKNDIVKILVPAYNGQKGLIGSMLEAGGFRSERNYFVRFGREEYLFNESELVPSEFKIGDKVYNINDYSGLVGLITKIYPTAIEVAYGPTKQIKSPFRLEFANIKDEVDSIIPEEEEMEEEGEMEVDGEERTPIHPKHYDIHEGYEVIDLMRETSTPEELEGFFRNNALKYLLRYKQKNGVEDIKKARYYLNSLIDLLEK